MCLVVAVNQKRKHGEEAILEEEERSLGKELGGSLCQRQAVSSCSCRKLLLFRFFPIRQ